MPAAVVETPKPTEPDRLEELARQTKRLASERMKFGHEVTREKTDLAKQREEFAKQKLDYEAWQAARADRRRNPEKYLSQDYGENWYEELSKYKLNGVPTAGLIQSEVDDRVGALQKQLDEQKAAFENRFKEEKQAENLRKEQEYLDSATAHVEGNAEKYPLIHSYGVTKNVAKMIADAWYRPAEGQESKVLTAEQAAMALEEQLTASHERATKAKQAKEEAAKPPPVAPGKPNAFPRRTLSNDMTASSAAPSTPPLNDAERMKRAIAAFAAASRPAAAH